MMATTSGLRSRPLATLLNSTASNQHSNTTLFPTTTAALQFNHSTWQHNTNGSLPGIQNTSGTGNATNLSPNCSNCYPNYTTVGPLLITYAYSLSYDYAYYAFLLILLIAALVCIRVGISRRRDLEQRAADQRRRARQQAENANARAANENNNTNNNNNPSVIAKEFDLPPTYEQVVQSYILNQQLPQNTPTAEQRPIATSAPTNTISASVSTITIESEVPNSNHTSLNCLNNNTIA